MTSSGGGQSTAAQESVHLDGSDRGHSAARLPSPGRGRSAPESPAPEPPAPERTAPETAAPTPPPDAGSTEDLLARRVPLAFGDPRRTEIRDAVVRAELPLVHHLAQRFRGRGEPYDDLVQVGTIGLLHAIDRFEPGRGSFTAFAVPTVLGEIRRHFRDRAWALRVPRRLQDLGRHVADAREELTQSLGRSPTVQEIAARIGVDVDMVVEALDTAGAYATVPLPTAADEVEEVQLGFVDERMELVEQRETLRPLLARLPARERRILALRFVRGMSQAQIAAEVGMSQMHVSRLLARSMTALREGLDGPE